MHRNGSLCSRLTAVCLATLCAGGALAQDPYVLVELKADGVANSRAYGLNNTGQVVGYVDTNGGFHAAHWLNDVFSDLHGTVHLTLDQLFNDGWSEAYAISDGDQVVGAARKKILCNGEEITVSTALLLRPAVLTDLGTPYPGDALTDLMTFDNACLALDSAAVGISNANHVVGWSDVDLSGSIHAFLVMPTGGAWAQGDLSTGNTQLIDLGTFHRDAAESSATDVNDSGNIVGWSYLNQAAYHAFLIKPVGGVWFQDNDNDGGNDLMADLGTLGGTNSWARGINNLNQVVGESDTADLSTHAFLWENGAMKDLGTLGGNNSSASRISDNGVIVGWAETPDGSRHACIWIDEKPYDLNELVLSNTTTSVVLTQARDVNENGMIAGWGRVSGVSAETVPFMLRLATDEEIAKAEEDAEAGSSTSGDTSTSSGVNTGSGDGTVSGVPILGTPNGTQNTGTDDSSSTGDDTTTEDVTPAPAMCGVGVASMLPLMLVGLVGLKRRRW